LITIIIFIWSLTIEGKHASAFKVEYFKEVSPSTSLLSIEDIVSSKDIIWKGSASTTLNFGHAIHPIWIRFPAKQLPAQLSILKIDFTQLDYVDLYLLDDQLQLIDHQISGDRVPLKERTISNTKPFFLIDKLESAQTVYLRTHTFGSNQSPITLLRIDEYLSDPQDIDSLVQLFSGYALFAALTFLMMFFVYNDSLYLYTMGWTLSVAFLIACYYNFIQRYLPIVDPETLHKLMPLSIVSAYAFATRYVQLLFKNWGSNKYQRYFRNCQLFAFVIFIVILTTDYQDGLYASFLAHIVLSPALLIIQYLFLHRNKQNPYASSASILLVTWSLYLATGVLQIGDELGFFPSLTFLNHSLFAGCMVVFFGTGLIIANNLKISNEAKIALEKELTATKESLFQSDKMNLISGFSSSLIHELKNPLNWTKSSLQFTLLKYKHDEILTSTLNDTMAGIDRIDSIVKGLNWFAKPTNLAVSDRLNIKDLIDNAVSLTGMHSNNITVKNEVEDNIFVRGSETHLAQVFINILSNSLKAIEQTKDLRDGLIHVTSKMNPTDSESKHRNIVIKWLDNGVGIEKEDLPKIFQPFNSLDSFREGSGLGLSIVHQIIHKHHGSIEVASQKYDWTEFSITLPLLDE
jgi:signal transduction histidine kinase